MDLKERAREWWEKLEPKQRQRAVQVGIAVVGISAAVAMYYTTGQSKKIPPPPKQVSVIQVGENRLQDDIRAQVEKQRQTAEAAQKQTDEKLAQQGKSQEEISSKLQSIDSALKALNGGKELPPGAAPGEGPIGAPNWPEAWGNGQVQARPAVAGVNPGPPPAPIEPQLVGAIAELSGPSGPESDAGKKKAGKKYFLPVSFMPAKLLTGLKAKTVETARNDPEPMLLRVQAPAVLPNEVREELQGCFVVANGFGSLASERVEAKVVSLNCVDFAGHSVIEADVTGILVDKDGVKGLAGHVVMKAGANMARAMVASAFQGAGQALSTSSQTVSTSPLGATQTIQPNEVGKAALGQGLAGGAAEISKVYLDLVRQSAPVVEHGADTDCTVVITQGAWLEVKSYESE